MTDRTVRVVLTGDATALIAAVNAARNSLNELNRSDTTRVQSGVRGAGSAATSSASAFDKLKSSMAAQVGVGNLAAMGVMSAFFAVKAAITDTVKATTDYQTTLFTLQAVTHSSGEVMVDVAAKARELGKDITIPGASATDAAKAMTELAKGGLSASHAMEAAKGTLLLAAAASVTASQAAEIEVNTLNAYGLAASQAGRVSDVLANAANQASGEMTDFANGLKMVGSTAHGFGISLEDTTTVLGLFANAGIKGEMGGTLLNTMLVRLAAPTKQSSEALKTLGVTTFDAAGNFEGMQAVTDQLRDAHDRLTPAAYAAATAIAFGTRGIRGAQILGGETASAYGLMSDALTKSGGAADLAGAKMQGLEGAFQQLTNQVQDAQLAVGLQLAPALTAVTTALGDVVGVIGTAVNWFGQLPEPIRLGAVALGAWLLLRGPLDSLFGMIAIKSINAAGAVAEAGGIMRFSMAAVETGAKAMWSAVGGWVGIGIAAITTAFMLFSGSTEKAAAGTADFTDAIDKNTGALTNNASATIAKQVADSGSGDLYRGISGNIQDYTAALTGNKDAQDAVHTAILDAATAGVESSSTWKSVGQAQIDLGHSARDVASGLLASGDAGKYQSDGLTAALNVSQRFADDSGKLSTAQDHVKQAIAGAGDAAGGAAVSQDSLNASMADGLDPATQMNTALKDYKTQADFATTAGDFLWASLQELAGNQIDAEHQTRLTEAAFRDMAASARGVTQANTDVENASAKTADAQKKLDDLAAHLGKTLDGQAESATNLRVTQADVDQASRDLTTAQNAEATAHDAVSKAQDTQFDAMTKAAQAAVDQAGKAYALKAATGDLKGASNDLTAATDAARTKFIETATQMGYNSDQANHLADQYGLIPKNVVTSIQQAGVPESLNELQRLRQAIIDLPDSKIVKVAVESGDVVYTTASGEKMKAEGGYISGPGTSTSDSIRARLSDGEFVVRASQTAKHRNLLENINTPGFAAGGLVDKNVLLQTLTGNLVDTGWQKGVDDQALTIAKSLALAVSGFNASQDPSSFGWVRGANIDTGYSWDGHSVAGGVAKGTERLWDALLSALVPQIPGGITSQMYGYENRNNVNNPGVPSFHSYGLAVDVNAPANPNGASGYGRSGVGVIPSGPAHSLAARLGMEWGGDFGGTPDPMHFEIHVPPGGITMGAAGVPAPVAGGAFSPMVERWRSTVDQTLASIGQPVSLDNAVLNQVRSESSGDPNAINLTDSNAQRGDPSIGLVQVIGSTFRNTLMKHGFANLIGLGQRNPVANLTAGELYAIDAYGSIAKGMRGVAYDNGGPIPPGFTMAYNGTGQTEWALTGAQMSAATSAMSSMSGVGRSQPINLTLTLLGDGPITEAALNAAQVTVDGAFQDVAFRLATSGAQSR